MNGVEEIWFGRRNMAINFLICQITVNVNFSALNYVVLYMCCFLSLFVHLNKRSI